MSGQNRKMVIAYKQFLSTWCHPNERKILGNVLLLYTGCLQHITNKVIYCRGGWLPCKSMTPDKHSMCAIMSPMNCVWIIGALLDTRDQIQLYTILTRYRVPSRLENVTGQTSNCFSSMPLVQVDLFNRAKQSKEPYFKIEKTEYQKFFNVRWLERNLCSVPIGEKPFVQSQLGRNPLLSPDWGDCGHCTSLTPGNQLENGKS